MTESGAAHRTFVVQEPGVARDARDQIREQVRRDVERALQDARRARADMDRAREEAGQAAMPPDGGPNPDPQIEIAVPPPPRIIIGGPGGAVTSTGQPFIPFGDIPPRVESVALSFFFTVAVIFIGTPLARAFGRRLDRKAVAPTAPAPDVVARLDRIEQAVDAIALEVERISEGQRYVTKLMGDARALGGPNDVAAHELRLAERAAAERAGQRVP